VLAEQTCRCLGNGHFMMISLYSRNAWHEIGSSEQVY
jgi:hypothetical protein